jgi:beta-lactamase superfamily II metal-dependent hydrolase
VSEATIRMYNVGFGDCFLLRLPAEDGERKVLFDCGSHSASKRPRKMSEVVGQIVEDVRDADGTPRIDVVVGTHRHQDHVSGFSDEQWAEVEVREVWMPWTEHPTDPEARRIREEQSRTAHRLAMSLQLSGDTSGLLELAENQLTNAAAMETLHHGFAGSPRRRFLPGQPEEGEDPGDELADSPLGGLGVRVLGPGRAEGVIRDMDPPVGESYLRMSGILVEGEDALSSAFGDEWVVDEAEFRKGGAFEHLSLNGNVRSRLAKIASEDQLAVAVALEKAVNGTSLVIAFAIGQAVLLFPADAQWGTWEAILSDDETRKLVGRTTFLKVGHHGSHNATPRDFVELLAERRGADGDGLAAMVSTNTLKRWPKIPKAELLEALAEVTPRVARSDQGGGKRVKGFGHWGEDYIDLTVPLG